MTYQTDRELLELAAKAALIEFQPSPFLHNRGDGALLAGGALWNPLTDDGDALRLAVKLGMELDFDGGSTAANDRHLLVYAHEFHAGMAMERTRRAIVRAAAAIAQNGATK